MYIALLKCRAITKNSVAETCSLYETVAVCTFGNSRIILMSADRNAVKRTEVLSHKVMLTL